MRCGQHTVWLVQYECIDFTIQQHTIQYSQCGSAVWTSRHNSTQYSTGRCRLLLHCVPAQRDVNIALLYTVCCCGVKPTPHCTVVLYCVLLKRQVHTALHNACVVKHATAPTRRRKTRVEFLSLLSVSDITRADWTSRVARYFLIFSLYSLHFCFCSVHVLAISFPLSCSVGVGHLGQGFIEGV